MCTAYEIGKRGGSHTDPDVADALDQLLLGQTRLIRPTLPAPVLLPDGSLREMSWGFRRQVKGAAGKPVKRTIVNSREDKLDTWTWKHAFRERRCLIPASAFFEWVDGPGKTKVPLRFESPQDRLLWIAGIWEESDEHGLCYSMITTEPTAVIAPIHDRMPAVLTEIQHQPFLRGELNAFGPSAEPLIWKETGNFLRD